MGISQLLSVPLNPSCLLSRKWTEECSCPLSPRGLLSSLLSFSVCALGFHLWVSSAFYQGVTWKQRDRIGIQDLNRG